MEPISPAGWSLIRPWIPPLSLSVREITSVSVTFVLSAATSDPTSETDLSLAVLGISTEDLHEDDDGVDDEDTSASESESKKTAASVVSSALAGGLSVEVDRSSWRRVFIRIDDKAEEAVIIVYGLMPGRQYEIVLELVQGGQTNSIRHQVTTEESETKDASHTSETESATKMAAPSTSTSETNGTATRPSTPPDGSGSASQPTSSPGYGFAPLTLEDRLTQLQHTLSVLNSEQVSLHTTIKSSRRDAQKADSNLRSEIEALKRASERYLSSEQRSKQKVLALQEAVKRTQMMTKDMEAGVIEVNNELPGLQEKKQRKEADHQEVEDEANKVRREKEEEEEHERKRIESMKSEMASLLKHLEKLEAKKEKVESTVIKDLEEELENVEKELETLEKEEEALSNGTHSHTPSSPFISPNWAPQSHPTRPTDDDATKPFSQGTIARPPINSVSSSSSIQRPRGFIHPNTVPLSNPQWTPVTSPRQPQHNQLHVTLNVNQRSSSLPQPNQLGNNHHPHPHHHHHYSQSQSYLNNRSHQPSTPTTILTNPNRQRNPTGGSGGLPPSAHTVVDSSESVSSNSSPSPGMVFTASGLGPGGTMLSSRAPPFEPGRGIVRR